MDFPSVVSIVIASFLAGLLGSPHCLGMCGGIVSAFGMSIRDQTVGRVRLLTLTYHLGRLLSYALLGLAFGFLGEKILAPFLHTPLPRAVLGAVFILIGLLMFGFKGLNQLERLGATIWQKMAPLRQKVFPLNTMPRALVAGLLWGFLPCGLVYSALLLSLSAHQPWLGAMTMFSFGLGTLPLLLVGATVAHQFSGQIQKYSLRKISAVLMILMGVWTLMPVFKSHDHHAMNHAQPANQSTHQMQGQPESQPTAPQPMNHDMPMDHDMSQMNHDMPMDHDMSQMNHDMPMDHDMSHMNHKN